MAREKVSPEGEALIKEIPPEFAELRHLVFVTYRDFPEIADNDFFQNRIRGFVMEAQGQQNPNRPGKEIRSEEEIANDFWNVQMPRLKEMEGIQDRTGGSGRSAGGQTDDDPGTLPGVLKGGKTVSVGGDRLYQVYEFPKGSGKFVAYQFNNRKQAEKVLGKNFPFENRRDAWFERNVLAQAPAEEVVGLEGNFTRLSDEIMADAARAAGIRDPGLAGQLANDPEMQEIMAQAVIGDWTPEQIKAEQRKTNFWKNELYPGIENFYDRTKNPEQAWREYQRTVQPALSQLGYDPDADGTYNSQVRRMLDKGIEADAFLQQAPTFIRATQNAEFASILNEWAERDLGKNIDFNDWFDLMQGESQPEIADVAERAQLEWVAQNRSAEVSDAQIRDLAARSQLSIQEAQQAFSEFNQGLLALGDDGLQRAGLDRDEILSAAAGVNPNSGRSIEEVRLQMAKVARENDLFDEEKINFFVGFDEQGRPNRPGLQNLTPEGA